MRTVHKKPLYEDSDEYYTLRDAADAVASYARRYLSLDTPIDCPADTEESEIPLALSAAGFSDIAFYTDLPYVGHSDHVRDGAVIVTNPPFSMKAQFSAWLRGDRTRRFIVCCTLVDFPYFFGGSIDAMTNHRQYKRPDGNTAGVATCWVTNFGYAVYPKLSVLLGKSKGSCALCKKETCVMQGTDTPLYTVHTAAKAGGVYSFCNRYQVVTGKCSFGRVFLTQGLEPTLRERDRRI